MASPQQSRIQSYLEKNKIGRLFEVSAKFRRHARRPLPLPSAGALWLHASMQELGGRKDAHVHAAFCTFREGSAGRDTPREVMEAVVIGMCLTSL
ncbi:hypothetical protein CgunFtcFv8_015943 [Champsocephalus gunnari]|uniref:Uncharacterized protein n=1 Tax=Champsocephalus gunnari TaxID=52237 RepID=A0AAN8H1L1_CHAGU|nr:hypothetical protein CgunFtcFv8_015943 [Champsocephalus gunnari]